MNRCLPAVLLALTMVLGVDAAQARPHFTTMDSIRYINWGGAVSQGNGMRVSGLPAIQSARESARRSGRSAPGERLNRPKFGATRDKSTARPSGRRVHKPIRITKRVDNASPMLRRAHATHRKLPRVVIEGRAASGAYLKYELKDVRITSYNVSRSAEAEMEAITMIYENIESD